MFARTDGGMRERQALVIATLDRHRHDSRIGQHLLRGIEPADRLDLTIREQRLPLRLGVAMPAPELGDADALSQGASPAGRERPDSYTPG
ncbi:MAG: hypothetical protein M3336_18245 [Chloroflexota bacterium]|nr:hypothetical protein [Chloroflexota bacterium]